MNACITAEIWINSVGSTDVYFLALVLNSSIQEVTIEQMVKSTRDLYIFFVTSCDSIITSQKKNIIKNLHFLTISVMKNIFIPWGRLLPLPHPWYSLFQIQTYVSPSLLSSSSAEHLGNGCIELKFQYGSRRKYRFTTKNFLHIVF